MRWRRVLGPAAMLASLVSAAWSFSHLESLRAGSQTGAQVLYLPSGKYLKVTSMGFPEVMADLIYIWSIQFYGHYDTADRFKYLDHIYGNVITELDPHYIDPYLIGAMIMSAEAGDPEMALRLLDKGIAANPDEWILSFDAGFLCYDGLKDFPRAARYFEAAMRAPSVPGVVRRMHAEMYNKMGNKRASLEYWTEVQRGADTDYVRDVSAMHVHDLTIEVDLEALREAVGTWRARHGSLPPDLRSLAAERLVSGEPVDPEGVPYLYDRRTGEVKSQSRFKLQRGPGR